VGANYRKQGASLVVTIFCCVRPSLQKENGYFSRELMKKIVIIINKEQDWY
jgi:hypothetical protein